MMMSVHFISFRYVYSFYHTTQKSAHCQNGALGSLAPKKEFHRLTSKKAEIQGSVVRVLSVGRWVGYWVAKISPSRNRAWGRWKEERHVTRRYPLPIFRPDCRNLTSRIRSTQGLARVYLQRDMRACEVGLRSFPKTPTK